MFLGTFKKLQQHYRELFNCLTSVGDIVALMFARECMSDAQRQQIMSKQTTYKIAEEFLSFMIRQQSLDTYNVFIEGLQQTKQPHLYDLLTTNGQ